MISIKFNRRPYDYIERIILDSLCDETDDWSFTGHEAVNKKKHIIIWTANGRWALRVHIDGVRISPGSEVVLVSLAPWRYRLWRHLERAKTFKTLQKLEAWSKQAAA